MSRFTETVERHAMDGYLDGRWYCRCDWSCCAVDRNAALTAHAAHVESMLVEAGVVAVELPATFTDETEWGVEMTRSDGKRVIVGPDYRAAMTHFANLDPDNRLMYRAVSYTPWMPAAAVRPVTPEEPK